MATPRLGLVVEDKPTELSCTHILVYDTPNVAYMYILVCIENVHVPSLDNHF